MASTLYLGRAPALVITKFNEFTSIYSSVTAALDALLERDHLLTKKYRFIQDEKYEAFDVICTMADTNLALQEVAEKLDSYVQYSNLSSRAAAIEELLLSPENANNDQIAAEEGTSDEQATSLQEVNIDEDLDIAIHLEPVVDEEETSDNESKKIYEKKKKRKGRKPKKHKKRHYEEESGDEDDFRKKRPRDVWRRVGSKFIGWYTCILCNKQMKSEDDYLKHIASHGDSHSPACMDCGNYFESMIAYEEHIGNLGKDLIFRCDEEGCIKTFQYKCRLECHKRTHIGELMYECNDCGHKLSSIRSIIRHTRAKHLNERPFQCHICEKAFAIQSQLTRHIKDHISPPHYTCEQCGRIFSSRQGYHYHQLDHLGIKPHKCSVCGKAFRNKTDMVNHERIHSGDRPFTCELCGKSFVEKGALRKHRVVHTREKNFVCSNCGKQFGYKCSLDGHLRKCQQDVSLLSMSSMPQPVSQPHNAVQHDKSQQMVEEATVNGPTDLSQATTSHEQRDRLGMYPCSMPNYQGLQHPMIPKSRPNQTGEDMQTHVSKGQGVRLIKKSVPYRPMTNHHPTVSKPGLSIPDPQMYSSYPVSIPQQRENTIDADILASVLGQKVPIQSQMEPIQYNERIPRDDGHPTHYRALNQSDREPTSHLLDGSIPTPSSVPGYNAHRQNHPVQSNDSMIFQLHRSHFRH